MYKTILAILFAVAVPMLLAFSCDGSGYSGTSDEIERNNQEQSLKEATSQIGMPGMVNYQEKKTAKFIIEQRDRADLICYAYLKSEYSGQLIFIGKCVGYGLPYSTQYINPERPIDGDYSGEFTTIPQADPNGLFMPDGVSATWLLMIDPKTQQPVPVYIEPEIIVSPFPLHKEKE